MHGALRRILSLGLLGILAVAVAWACEAEQTPTLSNPAPTAGTMAERVAPAPSGPSPAATPLRSEASAPEPALIPSPAANAASWRGLLVVPEHRCAPYDADAYSYSQSVEQRIVAGMGGIVYGPYTGTWFASTSETDIEHIVTRSEAHDSGLCAADAATRRRFSSDVLNLTLASPAVNRSQKSANDAAEWLPALNSAVRKSCRAGAPDVRPHRRPPASGTFGERVDGVFIDSDGCCGARCSPGGVSNTGPRGWGGRQCPLAL